MSISQLIPSSSGQIELILEGNLSEKKIGIVCHPHPLFGGSMNNKVVTTTSKAFQAIGIASLRFNFRGFGKSTGHYEAGHGELQDLLTVLAWLQNKHAPVAIWLAGFSFGSYIAFQGSLRWPCQQLITIAPPISRFDFSQTQQINCPWLLIQGDQDEVVASNEVFTWAKSITVPIKVVCLPGATHFFHGKLLELREVLIKNLHLPSRNE